MRRQLTLFLPPEHHVTLCRDDELVPWQAVIQRLASLGTFSITMEFGEPQVLPDGCVLLRPIRGAEQYQHLRQSILGPSASVHGAHITLLHPRNAAGVAYDLAAIAAGLAGLRTTLRTVSLIEQDGSDPWLVRRSYGAASMP